MAQHEDQHEDQIDDLYPQSDEVGEIRIWKLPLDPGELEVEAIFLGVASSQQDTHTHPGDFVTDSRKCPACRWFEPRIFRETGGDHRYIIYTVGASDVPGEVDFPRYRYARDAYEAVAAMRTPHPDTGVRALVGVSRRMMIQAAKLDPEIRTVLRNEGAPTVADAGWRTT